jgi:hypothetical protein
MPEPFRRTFDTMRRNPRPIRDALIVVGLARAFWYYVVQGIDPMHGLGVDARAYWGIDLAHPYTASAVGATSTYLYSPAFAQVLAPFAALPFPVFFALWTALLVGTLIWLVRPWPWALLIFALPVSFELLVGQVHLLIAASLVLAFRHPAAHVVGVFTKITPGIAVLWHPLRREWRAFAIVCLAIGAVFAVSFALSPSAWIDWFQFLTSSTGRGELLWVRIVAGIGLVVLGALTDRRWLVPVAVWIALPVVWIESWVILLAVIRLHPVFQERHSAPDRMDRESVAEAT